MRRRPFRRRRPIRPLRINPRRAVPAELIEANRLFEVGKYDQAGDLFFALAEKAERRGIPQAPNLYLKSGLAYLKEDKVKAGEKNIFKALQMMLDRKKWGQLKQMTSLVSVRLKDEGFEPVSKRIDQWVLENVPDSIRNSDLWKAHDFHANSRISLPANCQNCGANVNPAEIEWYDSDHAICAYCGSILSNNE